MALSHTAHSDPFPHYIFDSFIDSEQAEKLVREFPDYHDNRWFVYDNPLEKKRAIRDWGAFPAETYRFIHWLCSPDFVSQLCDITGDVDIVPDMGLHGAGWHLQGRGDHLNVHLDYSIHPLLGLQRKYNLIVYLSDWEPKWGGSLQLWSGDSAHPDAVRASITPRRGRAVLFDTTQNSWHGYFEPLVCPENVYRRSIAMYYLTSPGTGTDPRKRALYAPNSQQRSDPEIQALIKARSQR